MGCRSGLESMKFGWLARPAGTAVFVYCDANFEWDIGLYLETVYGKLLADKKCELAEKRECDLRLFWSCGVSHNLTHNRKRAGGGNGAESTAVPNFLEQKRPQSAQWRRFEGGISVGKDEVPSSNLGSSSKNPLKSSDFSGFFVYRSTFVSNLFLVFC